MRAIVPSSCMISHITPEGLSPAKREISTAASVWPARTSTPPSLARKGNTWPGVTISSLVLLPSMATLTVRARSPAEMPVVTPCRASIDTVKAVSYCVPLCRLMGSRPNCAQRSAVSARQMRPRPCVAMKLIAAGVAICAGMIRSPSFSRSSSSTKTNILPLRASSMISSIGHSTGRSSLAVRKRSSLPSVSAVGFQSGSVQSRSVLAWSPAARARPALDISPSSTMRRTFWITFSLIISKSYHTEM